MQKNSFSVIKGNYSEIYALYNSSHKSSGVDSDKLLNADFISSVAAKLSKKYKAVILASGKTDIITNGKKTSLVHNGTSQLSNLTGTGCMLGAVCASFISVCEPFIAAQNSCIYLGICGELSKTQNGIGSFMQNLMDKLSSVCNEEINKHIKTEVTQIE